MEGAKRKKPAREPMEKRAAKVKGRKRVPRNLLDGVSSGEEEFSDDEALKGEGDVLERGDEEAGPSTSAARAQLQWEEVEEGDEVEEISPP